MTELVDLMPGLADIGAYKNINIPFVISGGPAGQSNETGSDTGGSKTVGANIWMANDFVNPTAFVPAAFGTAPIVNNNNIAIQAANALRASGILPAARPIVVVFSALSGQSISDWVDGTPTDLWTPYVAALALLTSQFGTGWIINHVLHVQGEQDASAASFVGSISGTVLTVTGINSVHVPGAGSTLLGTTFTLATGTQIGTQITGSDSWTGTYNVSPSQTVASQTITSGTNYGTQALYAGAFARLVAKLQALPQWSATQSRITVQELGTWSGTYSYNRNDFFRTLANGSVYPFVSVVSSAGMVQSTQNPGPHFDGASLVKLGIAHFNAWRSSAPNGISAPGASTTYYGSAVAFPNPMQLTGTGSGPKTGVGFDDLRTGAIILYAGGNSYLPDPATCLAGFYLLALGSGALFSAGQANGAVFVDPNIGILSNSGISPYVVNLSRLYFFLPINGWWYVSTVNPIVGGMLDYTETSAKTAAASQNYNNSLKNSAIGTLNNTMNFTLQAGAKQRWRNDSTASGNTTITCNTANAIIGPDGVASTSYTVVPGNTVEIETFYTTGTALAAIITFDKFWEGRTVTKTTPTTGTTDTAPKDGYGWQRRNVIPAGTLAALTEPLPNNPKNGQQIEYYFAQAIAALTFSNGTVLTFTNGSAVTAGQKISPTYSSADSAWS